MRNYLQFEQALKRYGYSRTTLEQHMLLEVKHQLNLDEEAFNDKTSLTYKVFHHPKVFEQGEY